MRINKMVNMHSANYHVSPSGLTLGIHPFILFFAYFHQKFCWILSQRFWGRFSNMWCSKDREMCFSSQKIQRRHYYLCPPMQNPLQGSYQHPPGRRKLIILRPKAAFFSKIFFLPKQREKRKDTAMKVLINHK